MRQHGPKTAQGLGGNPRPELWNIPLKIGTDKVQSPERAFPLTSCQEAIWKASTRPEFSELIAFDLQHVQGAEFRKGDASSKGFTRLLQKINGCRS